MSCAHLRRGRYGSKFWPRPFVAPTLPFAGENLSTAVPRWAKKFLLCLAMLSLAMSTAWGRTEGTFSHLLARLQPWALIGYLVMVIGQWIVGYFFNEFLMSVMGINVLVFMSLLLIAIFSAFAHDAQQKL